MYAIPMFYAVLVEAGGECNEENHTLSVTGPQPAITSPNISSSLPCLKDRDIRVFTIVIPST